MNEVTLFRHFESKLKLLAAVLNQALLAATELDPGFTRITAPVGGWCGFLLGGGHTRYLAFKLPPELAGSIRPHPLTVKHHLNPNHRSGEQDALK